MSRIVQKKAIKGSQKWLQELANKHQSLFDDELRSRLQLSTDDRITWLSPLEEDEYSEYRDDAFLKRLSVQLDNRSLNSFWPRGGPVWDGLAKTSRGDIICVESKAHIQELSSSCQASPQSLELIKRSLGETAEFYTATSPENWLHGYYQYASRLAHNYLLRHLNGIKAWLVFLYFTNAIEMAGPKSKGKWRLAIETADRHLGIHHTQLDPYVIKAFIDVTKITGEDSGKKAE